MTNQKVLLLGATGETGGSILTGLLDYGKFVSFSSQLARNIQSHNKKQEITVLIRPSSADKPKVKGLVKRGVKILIADVSSPLGDLAPLLSGFDIFISAISALSLLAQINVATAAKKAGFKRFVPCGFATICPPGGVMLLRDEVSLLIPQNHLKFLPGIERKCPQPYQENIYSIHLHRRRLLIPALRPPPPIRPYRQVYLPRHEYGSPRRRQGTEFTHRFTGYRVFCS
jgi:hypothetical protein